MAFVVMQFGAEYDDVYNDVVKEVCKTFEVNVLRADEVSGPGLIIRVLPAFPWVRILV